MEKTIRVPSNKGTLRRPRERTDGWLVLGSAVDPGGIVGGSGSTGLGRRGFRAAVNHESNQVRSSRVRIDEAGRCVRARVPAD